MFNGFTYLLSGKLLGCTEAQVFNVFLVYVPLLQQASSGSLRILHSLVLEAAMPFQVFRCGQQVSKSINLCKQRCPL